MAHNLNIAANGEAALYLLKEKAWHGLGQVVEEAKTSDEVIKIAHLDWEVKKVPNYIKCADGQFRESTSFSVVRQDNEAILYAIARSQYTPLQNIEAFKYMDSLVQTAGDITYETAGALGQGEVTFVTAKLPGYIRIAGTDDVIEKYLIFTNSHSGGALNLYFSDIRVVCNNTLSASLRDCSNKVTLKHTTNILARLKEAEKLIGLSYAYNDKLTEALSALAKTKVNDKLAHDIVNLSFLTAEEIKNLAAGVDLSTRKQNSMNEVYAAMESAPGQELHRGTALHVYNGVTSYFQNVKQYSSADRKMQGLNVGGYESVVTQRAFDELLALV